MLGPRPGARKRANKLNVSGLGRSLVNQQRKDQKQGPTSERYTTDVNPYGSGSNLKSVTEQQPLDEMLSTAEMSGKDFTTERTAAVKLVNQPSRPMAMSKADREQLIQQHYDNAGKLTVPRRPHWTREMSSLELDRLEKEAFLAWRRSLAQHQESPELRLAITPFERNIEVWRQLWRVIERSDLVVQIVDARNPLLYRSEDLDRYALSFGTKRTLLLINKADLLSENQRKLWAQFLNDNNIPYAFFSAKQASEEGSHEHSDNEATRILSVDELETLFKNSAPPVEKQLQVGLVGYPNVGKSSTINALIGAKKVSVSSTPGKTKHFQTIHLTKDLMLCDCPGLVFPNFAQTKAELVCQGVLPIDQLRDYMSPVELVTSRIPKPFLERTYHVRLHTDPVTALDLLETYAGYRGFQRTGGGMPDASRAARIVLKDYVGARLPFVMPPPSYDGTPEEFNADILATPGPGPEVPAPTEGASVDASVTPKVEKLQMEDDMLEDELDKDFFSTGGQVGKTSVPFHMRKQVAPNSKKHNKGRKARK